jgi:hypothetical protein
MSILRPKSDGCRQNNHGLAVYLPKPGPTFPELDGSFTDLLAFLDQSILR